MSGMPSKSQIQTVSRLPNDGQVALIEAKNELSQKTMPGKRFLNKSDDPRDAPRSPVRNPLPRPANGCIYLEVRVGAAHHNDPKSASGKRRLVLEVVEKSFELREVYLHENHFRKGEFRRLYHD